MKLKGKKEILIKNIKKKVKKDIKSGLPQYNIAFKSNNGIYKMHSKTVMNSRIIESRLSSLITGIETKKDFRGYKDRKKAIKIYNEYNRFLKLFNEKFNKLGFREMLNYSLGYSKNITQNLNKAVLISFLTEYNKIIQEMTKKSQKITIVEEFSPILKEGQKKLNELFLRFKNFEKN